MDNYQEISIPPTHTPPKISSSADAFGLEGKRDRFDSMRRGQKSQLLSATYSEDLGEVAYPMDFDISREVLTLAR